MRLQDPVGVILKQKGHHVFTVTPELTVYEALEIMAEHGIGALVVMSGTELVGVISERDYARKVILEGRSSKEAKVRDIMSSPPVTVDPHATVDECMQLMTEMRSRHLPVVLDGELVGLVSIGDLVHWIITCHELTIRQLEDYITGKYPA